ncbi:MAG TPA: protein phosphatase 2C domain-containing protein [Ktedonobacterales bacterium]|nr:protein phosphatase 2C domain-containing protein [Ktedonobacterales bacterium]
MDTPAPREILTIDGQQYVVIPVPPDAQPAEPLPASLALQQIISIGEALAYLHNRGVAHLKVQPASIVLVNGRACLSNPEDAQVMRASGDDAQLLFERDANFLALTLAALTIPGSGGPQAQAIDAIREHGISHNYQSVAQVIADCQQALALGQDNAHQGAQSAVSALTVLTGHATSVGRVRSNNEDALGSLLMTVIDGRGQPCLAACFIVADGVGGEDYGELASQIAVQQIMEQALRKLALPAVQHSDQQAIPWNSELDTIERERQMREALVDGFHLANREIRALGQARGKIAGTTATALLIFGRQALIGHAGDSRAYRLNSGVLAALTEDHSYVQRLIQLGQIGPDNRAGQANRNKLYRALGQQDHIDIDVIACPLEPGDRFLLCSDGLWDAVPETLLADLLGQQEQWLSPMERAARLVALADEAGGADNSTALVIEIEGEQPGRISEPV